MSAAALRRIQRLAGRTIQPVTIQQLLLRSAVVSDEQHLAHAKWLREELSIRLAHRLEDFFRLHFVVICNSRFHEVFRLFLHAFDSLVESEEVRDTKDVPEFANLLQSLVRGHDNIIQMMQEGYGELQTLLDDMVDLDVFLNQTFFTRIGNRILAENFLSVHEARINGNAKHCTGVVNPDCAPAEIVRNLGSSLRLICDDLYGLSPRIALEGQLDTELSFIPDHLSFMLQEIMKNAMRATVESHLDSVQGVPPVTVEIMKGSFDVTIKVSDAGGGMKAKQLERIWKYGYTSVDNYGTREESSNLSALCGQDKKSFRQMAGYGFGLPLSRVYARYFGGDIHVQSMHGYGTDVYLNINHLGNMHHSSLVAS